MLNKHGWGLKEMLVLSGILLLFLIIATNSIEENRNLYNECIHNLRSRLLSVTIHSELGPKTKVRMLIQGLFPVWWAKRELRKNQAALAKDKME